jgi:UDP-N-acetylmuramoylalanine--D-glutamate ligase
MGEAAEPIRSALGQSAPTKVASAMQDAVTTAYQDADPGDIVLLSPGCASFDWYSSYAERGDDFRRAVKEIEKKASGKA